MAKLWIENGTIKYQGKNQVATFPIGQIDKYSPNPEGTRIYINMSAPQDNFYVDYASLTEFNGDVVPTFSEILVAFDTAFAAGSSGSLETPTMTVYSSGTTIAAGKKSVTIITDSSFAGTVLGAVAAADMVYTFTASAGNTLGAIAITRSAGSFTVLTTE